MSAWRHLLDLVRDLRAIAYRQDLAPDDAMRRIRGAFGEYDGTITED